MVIQGCPRTRGTRNMPHGKGHGARRAWGMGDEQVVLLEPREEHVQGHQVVAGHVHEVVHGKGQAK